MAIIKKHIANIDERGVNIIFENVVNWKQQKLNLKGKRVEIVIKKFVKHRSTNQNSYYWGCILPLIADYMGETTTEAAHDAMRGIFLCDRTKKIITLKSTKELSTIEFEEYLKRIRIFMANEHNVYIPLANEIV